MTPQLSINPFSQGDRETSPPPGEHAAGIPLVPTTYYFHGGTVTRIETHRELESAHLQMTENPTDYLVTILISPSPAQITQIDDAWNLHPVLVENLESPQQGKFQEYGTTLYLPMRAAYYRDSEEEIELVPIQLLLRGQEAVIVFPDGVWTNGQSLTLENKNSPLHALTRSEHPRSVRRVLHAGPVGLIYWLVDSVVDSYMPALQGLEQDKEQIEVEVFSGDGSASERIYRLNQEAVELQHAASSLARNLPLLERSLEDSYPHPELQTYFGDLNHHLHRSTAEVRALKDALAQILTVNSTLVAQRQNDDMKKISGWAGVLFAPTLVAGIYGMNFIAMPELDWAFGYPAAIGLMIILSSGLYLIFRGRDWI